MSLFCARNKDAVHFSGSEQLPGPLFHSTFKSIQPQPAPIAVSGEFYQPDSLPTFPVASESQQFLTPGKGHVAYGEKRHLVDISAYWEELREQFKNDEIKLDKKSWEGIILMEYMHVSFILNRIRYSFTFQHWWLDCPIIVSI